MLAVLAEQRVGAAVGERLVVVEALHGPGPGVVAGDAACTERAVVERVGVAAGAALGVDMPEHELSAGIEVPIRVDGQLLAPAAIEAAIAREEHRRTTIPRLVALQALRALPLSGVHTFA